MSNEDFLATLTELSAKQIALACKRFGGENITNGATDDVLLRGGVCNNAHFVERCFLDDSSRPRPPPRRPAPPPGQPAQRRELLCGAECRVAMAVPPLTSCVAHACGAGCACTWASSWART